MSASSATSLEALQQRLGYTFRQPALLACAVTHASLLSDKTEGRESNQRLEFLGDAVLQLVITEALYRLFPAEREGALSKRRAALSKGAYLARLAQELGLGATLQMTASEEAAGGRSRPTALEDAFEALVGAIYLDSDLPTTRDVLLRIYGDLPARLEGVETIENPKGRLQELVQPAHGNSALRYEVVRTTGVDHAREFEVKLFLLDRELGTGHGTSKKQAEEAAARAALVTLPQTL